VVALLILYRPAKKERLGSTWVLQMQQGLKAAKGWRKSKRRCLPGTRSRLQACLPAESNFRYCTGDSAAHNGYYFLTP
jgi:hypothetical protein